MHAFAFVHDTALKYVPVLPRGTGLGITDQWDPFHRSISGTVGDAAVARLVPTAMHTFGVAHDTPVSALAIEFGLAGLGTTVQPRPFQRSTSGRVWPFTVIRLPTAKHVAVARAGPFP